MLVEYEVLRAPARLRGPYPGMTGAWAQYGYKRLK